MPEHTADEIVRVDAAAVLQALRDQNISLPSGTELHVEVSGLGTRDSGTVVVP